MVLGGAAVGLVVIGTVVVVATTLPDAVALAGFVVVRMTLLVVIGGFVVVTSSTLGSSLTGSSVAVGTRGMGVVVVSRQVVGSVVPWSMGLHKPLLLH